VAIAVAAAIRGLRIGVSLVELLDSR